MRLNVDVSFTNKTQNRLSKIQELIGWFEEGSVRIAINKKIGNAINQFVPQDNIGDLRDSMEITHHTVEWGENLDYAHYQYEGEIYGKNYPIIHGGEFKGYFNTSSNKRLPVFSGGTITGWYSLPGVEKYPTGRELGKPGYYKGWKFGYTTPGTQHHWIDAYLQNKNDVRRRTNISIAQFLKRRCKEYGLNK